MDEVRLSRFAPGEPLNVMDEVVRILTKYWDCRYNPKVRFREKFHDSGTKTFDMAALEKVVEMYDDERKIYEGICERKLDDIDSQMRNEEVDFVEKVVGLDTNMLVDLIKSGWCPWLISSSRSEGTSAVCPGRIKLSYLAMSMQFLYHDLAVMRLYKVEKRFGFTEEMFDIVGIDEGSVPGAVESEAHKARALSFRQMMDNPEALLPPRGLSRMLPPREKRGKKTTKAAKKPSIMESIADFERHCKELTQIVKTEHESMRTEPYRDQKLPRSFTYRGIDGIAHPISKPVRQCLFDLENISKEIAGLTVLVRQQRDDVRRVLMYWFATGVEFWEHGKGRTHEMRMMREYEYDRTTLAAMFVNARHLHLKAASYFMCKKGEEFLSADMAKAMKIDHTETFTVVENDWEGTCRRNRKEFPPVEEMMEFVEKKFDEVLNGNPDWWKRLTPIYDD